MAEARPLGRKPSAPNPRRVFGDFCPHKSTAFAWTKVHPPVGAGPDDLKIVCRCENRRTLPFGAWGWNPLKPSPFHGSGGDAAAPLLQTHHEVPNLIHGVVVCPTRPGPGGGPGFILLGGSEFRLRQGFAPGKGRHGQNACTAQAPPRPPGGKRTRPR